MAFRTWPVLLTLPRAKVKAGNAGSVQPTVGAQRNSLGPSAFACPPSRTSPTHRRALRIWAWNHLGLTADSISWEWKR